VFHRFVLARELISVLENIVTAVTAAILSLVPHWTSDKSKDRAEDYAAIIVEECEAVQPKIDPFLVVAIAYKESSFRAKIKGKRGEVGLMQVLPNGALTRTISKQPQLLDVRSNIRVGIGHLNYWQNKCGEKKMDVWISAYNAGRCTKTDYAKRIRRVYCKVKPGGCGGVS
jgi:soluble lytic murein transglycosylase-like protein